MTHADTTTIDRSRTLEALDLVQRAAPFCERCGQPTLPVTRDGSLWLECPAVGRDRSFVRRVLDADLGPGHTRRIIADDAA